MVTILSKIINLTYEVERDHDRFYIVLTNSPSLPGYVLDQIESFAYIHDDTFNNPTHDILSKIRIAIIKYWDPDFGVPQITFTGNTSSLRGIVRDRPVYIFTHKCGSTLYESVETYLNAMRYDSKSTCFIVNPSNRAHITLTANFKEARSAMRRLLQVDPDHISSGKQPLMVKWFGRLADTLKVYAQDELTQFFSSIGSGIVVPEFIVVDEDHIRRYRLAYEYLMNKYQPLFVMSRHLTYEQKRYTILFPMHRYQR